MPPFPIAYSHSSTSFQRIPMDVPGALFVSPMPYGKYDRERVFRQYRRQGVNRVVVLLSDEEIKKRCKKDLIKLYQRHGMAVTRFPMVDFLQPGHARMDKLVPELVQSLRNGERIAVHCHAGVGRSSVVAVCLCAVLMDQTVDEALEFIRAHMETNITVEQKNFVRGWIERLREPRPDKPVRIRNAEVVATGAELLQGRTLNLHGHTLGALLTEFGIPLVRETVLPDDTDAIRVVVLEALTRSDLVIVTGGLGPTDDDRTLAAVADALARPVTRHAAADAHLQAWFDRIGREPTPAQCRQAHILEGAEVTLNACGIAPGQRVTLNNQRHLWLLPGPPAELSALVRDGLRPWLASAVSRSDRHTRLFRIVGHSESRVQDVVSGFGEFPRLDVAYCARPGSVELRFTGTESDVERACALTREHFAGDLLNESGDPVEQEVGRRLLGRGETVATAESCTAGGIGAALTRVPGSSAWVRGGVIAYDNALKTSLLGVDPETLAREGAVSEATAREMALGARSRCEADWGLSITGIAGPGGGTSEKPVGLFFVGVAGPRGTRTWRFQVNGDRERIREHGVNRALECLWRELGTNS